MILACPQCGIPRHRFPQRLPAVKHQPERYHGPMTVTGRISPPFEWLGHQDYEPVWQRMRLRASDVALGQATEIVWACEHAPVYTTGRRGVDNRMRERLPAPFVHADRGGETTFHGPGQLMLYPVMHLGLRRIGVKMHVRALEESCLRLLDTLGVRAYRRSGFPGAWTARGKIAAVGVRVIRGVAFHGMSLNVTVDHGWFAAIRPCGLNAEVCRIADFLSPADMPPLALLARQWYDCFCEATAACGGEFTAKNGAAKVRRPPRNGGFRR